MSERYRNFFIRNTEDSIKFTSKNQGGSTKSIPEVDRAAHGNMVMRKLQHAWQTAGEIGSQRKAVALPTKHGTYLEFESPPDFELATKSLEFNKSGIRLLNVKTEEVDGHAINKATVFIPNGKESFYLKRVQAYIERDNPRNNKPCNQALIASINDIKLAVLESFWIGNKTWIPEEKPEWCEIWLSSDSNEIENSIRAIAAEINMEMQNESLEFPERRILLGKANRQSLQELIERSSYIAEFRRASEAVSFFIDLENRDQIEWAKDLAKRASLDKDAKVSICILDTGVNNGHILLRPLLSDNDCIAYLEEWGPHDIHGHGTSMAGVAAYGDLQAALESQNQIKLNHILESVKILPNRGENDTKLYGAITAQSVSSMTIENPDRKRIICMAITAPKFETSDGRPSSWSAAIDELTSGYIDGLQKLFFVSAGNIVDMNEWANYPLSNISLPIQNPGQSWNAITVGAYTEKINIDKGRYKDATVVAPKGGLSPYSSTSRLWDNKWPIKPDIVLEGGNLLKESWGCSWCEDLSMLTTFYKPTERQFGVINATSAATAEAAWMAAQIQSAYPEAWPETIRALLIHSADWTLEMKNQFLTGTAKSDYRDLMRVCGYGVPNLEKALWCAKNSVNLIIQSEFQPFDKLESGRYVTKDMHIHELPWPKQVLEDMFDAPVSMRVTLSYFIEPGPGEIGWKDRYRYASCALRFNTNGSDTKEAFLGRINAAAEDETYESDGGGVNWILGDHNRHLGSVHSDIWNGTAAQLASSNFIAVYPAIGWWRERAWIGRWNKTIRYSLIVSVTTPEQDVDLYTSIITKIKVPVEIKIQL